MKLYLEDWSHELPTLWRRGIKTADKLIKVFALPEELSVPYVYTIDSDHAPLGNERLKLSETRFINMRKVETHKAMLSLPVNGRDMVRALIRFSVETGHIVYMAQVHVPRREFSHPIDVVHGLQHAIGRGRIYGLHLDFYLPESIGGLQRLIDINLSDCVVSPRKEGVLVRNAWCKRVRKEF